MFKNFKISNKITNVLNNKFNKTLQIQLKIFPTHILIISTL